MIARVRELQSFANTEYGRQKQSAIVSDVETLIISRNPKPLSQEEYDRLVNDLANPEKINSKDHHVYVISFGSDYLNFYLFMQAAFGEDYAVQTLIHELEHEEFYSRRNICTYFKALIVPQIDGMRWFQPFCAPDFTHHPYLSTEQKSNLIRESNSHTTNPSEYDIKYGL